MTTLITSRWRYENGDWDGKDFSNRRVREQSIFLEMVCDGKKLEFIGGPTGFESYYVASLVCAYGGQPRPEELCICAGTINSWPACYVPWDEVMSFVESAIAAYKEGGQG